MQRTRTAITSLSLASLAASAFLLACDGAVDPGCTSNGCEAADDTCRGDTCGGGSTCGSDACGEDEGESTDEAGSTDEGSSDEDSRCGPTRGVVDRVIDGDTVTLASGDKVRYLLVDTPEMSEPRGCYAEEARNFNRQLVEGQEVTLAYDVECEDDFGRLLAYVSVGDRSVNELLLERGFACTLIIPPNGHEEREHYEALEAQARAGRVGMWGSCADIDCD